MARQVVNVGNNPNDGTGTPLRDAMIIVNDNFLELYTNPVVNTSVTVGNSSVNSVTNSTSLVFGNNSSTVRVGSAAINAITNSSGFYTTGGTVSANTVKVSSNTINVGTYTSAANGYTFLPNGFKLNYGYVLANNSTGGNATFSSAFATACYVVTATSNTTADTYQAAVTGTNTSVALIRTANVASVNVFYMAIGV